MLVTPVTEDIRRRFVASLKVGEYRRSQRRKYVASHPCAHCGGPIRDCTPSKAESRQTCSRSCGSKGKWALRRSQGLRRGCLNRDGYRLFHRDGKNILAHRVVMEEMIGRSLLRSESVHHINGNRDDNRPENLELWTKAHPAGVRMSDKSNHHCPTCTCHVRVGEET